MRPRIVCVLVLAALVTLAVGDETIQASVGWTISLSCKKAPAIATVDYIPNELGAKSRVVFFRGKLRDPYASRFQVSQSRSSFEIVIANIQSTDEGQYRCYENSSLTANIINVVIAVKAQEPTVSKQLPAGRPSEGEQLRVQCLSLRGKPAPTVFWEIHESGATKAVTKLEGNSLTTRNVDNSFNVVNTLTLTLSRAIALNQSSVLCVAQTPRFEQTVRLLLDSMVAPLPPVVTYGGRELTAGQRVKLECSSDKAIPAASLSWHHGDRLLASTERISNNPDGTFKTVRTVDILTSAEFNNYPLYCQASNEALRGSYNVSKYRKDVKLVIRYAPTFSSNFSVQNASEGETVTLSFKINSYPPYTYIKWQSKRESSAMLDLDSKSDTASRSERFSIVKTASYTYLTIVNVQPSDQNEYFISAENEVGTGISNPVKLNVFHSPICSNSTKLKYGVERNTEITINCSVVSNPPATQFSWRFPNGTRLRKPAAMHSNAKDEPALVTQSLRFVAKSDSDYGTLVCNASNQIGSMKSACNIVITLPGPAEPPRMCEILKVQAFSVEASCVPGFDGGYPLLFEWKVKQIEKPKSRSRRALAFERSALAQFIGSSEESSNRVRYRREIPEEPVLITHEAKAKMANLQQDTRYLLRICSYNSKYPKRACSNEIEFKTLANSTAGSPGLEAIRAAPDGFELGIVYVFIIVGVIVFLIVVCVILWISCVWHKKSASHRKQKAVASSHNNPQEFCFSPFDVRSMQTDCSSLGSEEINRKYRNARRKTYAEELSRLQAANPHRSIPEVLQRDSDYGYASQSNSLARDLSPRLPSYNSVAKCREMGHSDHQLRFAAEPVANSSPKPGLLPDYKSLPRTNPRVKRGEGAKRKPSPIPVEEQAPVHPLNVNLNTLHARKLPDIGEMRESREGEVACGLGAAEVARPAGDLFSARLDAVEYLYPHRTQRTSDHCSITVSRSVTGKPSLQLVDADLKLELQSPSSYDNAALSSEEDAVYESHADLKHDAVGSSPGSSDDMTNSWDFTPSSAKATPPSVDGSRKSRVAVKPLPPPRAASLSPHVASPQSNPTVTGGLLSAGFGGGRLEALMEVSAEEMSVTTTNSGSHPDQPDRPPSSLASEQQSRAKPRLEGFFPDPPSTEYEDERSASVSPVERGDNSASSSDDRISPNTRATKRSRDVFDNASSLEDAGITLDSNSSHGGTTHSDSQSASPRSTVSPHYAGMFHHRPNSGEDTDEGVYLKMDRKDRKQPPPFSLPGDVGVPDSQKYRRVPKQKPGTRVKTNSSIMPPNKGRHSPFQPNNHQKNAPHSHPHPSEDPNSKMTQSVYCPVPFDLDEECERLRSVGGSQDQMSSSLYPFVNSKQSNLDVDAERFKKASETSWL